MIWTWKNSNLGGSALQVSEPFKSALCQQSVPILRVHHRTSNFFSFVYHLSLCLFLCFFLCFVVGVRMSMPDGVVRKRATSSSSLMWSNISIWSKRQTNEAPWKCFQRARSQSSTIHKPIFTLKESDTQALRRHIERRQAPNPDCRTRQHHFISQHR